jgi:surface protein
MEGMFLWCSSFNETVLFSNLSSLTTTESMFQHCSNFNRPISFNTPAVTNMAFMFSTCIKLDNKIELDTSNVTDMSYMFSACLVFNEKLDFETGNVDNMRNMFNTCTNFNQNIAWWNVSKVTQHAGIFNDCGIEEMFKPLFKRANETSVSYNNRNAAHLNTVEMAKKENFRNSRGNWVTVSHASKSHYPKPSYTKRESKQPTNVEKVIANRRFSRHILGYLGDPKYQKTRKKGG